MATKTRVRITGGGVSIEVTISYRWYVPGNDPWTRVSGASSDFPSSGDWENRQMNGGTAQVRMYTASEGAVAELNGFTKVGAGSTGGGYFLADGYTITQYSSIDWEVLSIV